jgi:hypothetical protein
MSENFGLKQYGCRRNGCGQHSRLCPTCAKSYEGSTNVVPPFTKKGVKQLHNEMYLRFCSSPNGSTIKLTVPLNSMLVEKIDWTTNNCGYATLVLMLSSSNAGLNSINQQIFAGYILAVIINAIQETGSCDPIILEVFRLEMTKLSGNPVWSSWSELVEFHDLYNACVKYKIIIANEIEIVTPNDDNGSYDVGKSLNGKYGSTLVEAHKWSPSNYHIVNGILSADTCSKHRIWAVVLCRIEHFFTIIIRDGRFCLIDGKGKRIDEFKAESTLRELTIEQFLELCASYGAFYLLEEVPFVSENAQCVLLPPASSAQVAQVLPPPLPQPVPCANVAQALPPPPPHHCASGPLVPSPLPSSELVIVWFGETSSPDYYYYDKWHRVLRNMITGSIIDDIRAGSYEVRTKNTHEFIKIELNEVQSPASLLPSPQQLVRPKLDQKIEIKDIQICNTFWSITKGTFSKSGTYSVASGQFTIDGFTKNIYNEFNLIIFLNCLYNVHQK